MKLASRRHLLVVLVLGIALVFTVLIIEFRSFYEPIAIVFGSVLALVGTAGALWLTETTLNIVSFLGAIIGVGIVAKNGILMLDLVGHHVDEGLSLEDALVKAGHRRLRPILMTSLATVLAMLPLAWGVGRGADMLRPLAIGTSGPWRSRCSSHSTPRPQSILSCEGKNEVGQALQLSAYFTFCAPPCRFTNCVRR